MDTPELDLRYMDAGREYLTAIQELGLDPYALLWAYDEVVNGFVLVLITELFDFKGPLAISQLLFKAYNASMTPQEIDPFIVRLHSPAHEIVPNLLYAASMESAIATDPVTGKEREPVPIKNATVAGLTVSRDWVLRSPRPARKADHVALLQRWKRFERNVDRAAA